MAKEMVKTAIEDRQDLIVEGCYIPFDWAKDLDERYRPEIRHICLVMSERYIREHFDSIKAHANAVGDRSDDSGCTLETLPRDDRSTLERCQKAGTGYVLIDDEYDVDIQL